MRLYVLYNALQTCTIYVMTTEKRTATNVYKKQKKSYIYQKEKNVKRKIRASGERLLWDRHTTGNAVAHTAFLFIISAHIHLYLSITLTKT